MDSVKFPQPKELPRKTRWRYVIAFLVMYVVLGVIAFKLVPSISSAGDDRSKRKDMDIAHLHTLALAGSIVDRPPVSVTQIDELLVTTRATHARLEGEEARAWTMRDLIDLGSARQALQLAEENESSANNVLIRNSGASPTFRYQAEEYRRRALGMLWRFRQLKTPTAPVAPVFSASAASAASASAPASTPTTPRPAQR